MLRAILIGIALLGRELFYKTALTGSIILVFIVIFGLAGALYLWPYVLVALLTFLIAIGLASK